MYDKALALSALYQTQQLVYTVTDADVDMWRIRESSRLYIWAGASDHTIYPAPSLNWLFRAYHDQLHISSGFNFSLSEEIELTKRAIFQLGLHTSPELAKLYWIDNVGQQLAYYQDGKFPDDQKAFVESVWNDRHFTDPRD